MFLPIFGLSTNTRKIYDLDKIHRIIRAYRKFRKAFFVRVEALSIKMTNEIKKTEFKKNVLIYTNISQIHKRRAL